MKVKVYKTDLPFSSAYKVVSGNDVYYWNRMLNKWQRSYYTALQCDMHIPLIGTFNNFRFNAPTY